MDDELITETIPKKSTQRSRRRTSLFSNQSNGSAVQDNGSLFSESTASQMIARPGRRLATWADDTNNDIQQLRTIQSTDFSKANKQKLMDSANDDVTPLIPDIEEVKDYEMSQQVAEPPSAHNQIISFQELDKNLLKQSAFTLLDGIDLSCLTHFCLPESQVKEPDIPWSWDNLMSDVMSRLASDRQSEDLIKF